MILVVSFRGKDHQVLLKIHLKSYQVLAGHLATIPEGEMTPPPTTRGAPYKKKLKKQAMFVQLGVVFESRWRGAAVFGRMRHFAPSSLRPITELEYIVCKGFV